MIGRAMAIYKINNVSRKSQSPLIGAMIGSEARQDKFNAAQFRSQSPLIGAMIGSII
jgi:hypothetical protein